MKKRIVKFLPVIALCFVAAFVLNAQAPQDPIPYLPADTEGLGKSYKDHEGRTKMICPHKDGNVRCWYSSQSEEPK